MSKKIDNQKSKESIRRYFICNGCETEFTIAGCKLEVPECSAQPSLCPFESTEINWREIDQSDFDILD